MVEERGPAPPRLIGLSIEPDAEYPHRLVLKMGTSRFGCNLYLDHPDFERLGAGYTLDCWITALERLSRGDDPAVLLPFDFADQCTGWLRVTVTGDGLAEVRAGWSAVSQYQLTPADLVHADRRIVDFEPVRDARIVRPLADVIAAVRAARATAADQAGGGPPGP